MRSVVLTEQVVRQDGRIGKNDALDGRVGDVALVPEGDVFERRLGVAAQDAGKAADLFRGDGVLLVRHGRRALLLLAEVLLRLANFGALQVADFDGDLVEGAAEDGQRADVGGVAIALDDLRGYGRRLEAEAGADALFVLGLEVAEGADGARELADAHVFGGGVEAGEVALHLGIPVQQLETEGCRLGVDAVGAADGGRVLELDGAMLEHGKQRPDALLNELRCLFYLQCLGCIDDVVRRQAIVQPAGGLAIQAFVFESSQLLLS